MSCPNINSPEWKELIKQVPESIAYTLWDKYDGNVPKSAIDQLTGNYDTTLLNNAASKLDNSLRQILANMGISYQAVDAIKDDRGNVLSAVAKADMLNKIVQVIEGKADATTLPEEASHFFVEALDKNGHVYKSMYEAITKYSVYQQVVEQYGNLSDYTEESLRKEAMAKVLAQELINTSRESTLSVAQQKTLFSWWNMVLSKLKQMFSKFDHEKFNNAVEEFSPFKELAAKIAENNLEDLSAPINPSHSYYQLDNASPNQVQKDIMDKIMEGAKGITKVAVGEDRGYEKEGKRLGESVTTKRDRIFDAKYANRPANPELEERKVLAGKIGSAVHDDIDNIVKRILVKDAATQKVVKSDPETYRKLEAYILQLGKQYKNAVFLAEQIVYNPKTNTPGTVDLIVINSDGKVDIYDWKTMTLDKMEKKDFGEPKRYKTEKYEYQLTEYRKILSNYGIKEFGKIRYVPIETKYKVDKNTGKRSFIGIDVGNADTKQNIEKTYLNPIPTAEEKTGEEDIDKLLDQLKALHREVSTKKSTSDVETAKKQQRIKQLTRAIRELQLNKNFAGFVVSADVEFQTVRARLADKNNPPSESELVDMKEHLRVYEDLHNRLQNLYSNNKINAEHRKRFDAITNEAAALNNQLNKLLKQELIKAAGKVGVTESSLTRFEEQGAKAIGPASRLFKAVSRIDHPLFKTLWNLVNKAKMQTQKDSKTLTDQIGEKVTALKEWGKAKGLKGTAIYDLMLDRKKGKLISKFSETYYKTKQEKIKKGDWQWIKANSVVDEPALKKYLADQRKFLESHVFSSDKQYNEAVRKVKLKELEEKYDVFTNPKAYLNGSPYMTKFIKPTTAFYSEGYKRLLDPANKPALDFYELFTSKMREFNQFMPLSAEGKLVNPDRFIPNISEGILEQALNAGGSAAISGLGDKFFQMFEFSEADAQIGAINEFTGEYEKKVPVYYTREIPADEKSYDLGRVLALFGETAYNFKHMSEIEGSVRNLRGALQSSRETLTDATGGAIKDAYSGKVQLKNVSAETLSTFDDLINYYVYGIKQTDNYGVFTVEKKVKNPETGEYEIVESKYSRNKVGSAVLKAFATKALGLNLISQSANLVGGLANTAIIATGGNFFTLKQFAKAGQLISSGNFNPKVMAVMEYLNLRGDSDIYKRANQVSVNDTARKMDVDKFFWLQEKADSLIFNNVGLAFMMNFGVDKDGKVKRLDKLPAGTKSILDSLEVDKDGKLNMDKIMSEEEFRKLRNKMQGIGEKITGMSTRDNVSGYRMTMMGQALMQFRGWIPRTLGARFGATSYDAELEAVERGRYRSLMSQLINRRFLPLIGEAVTGLVANKFGQNTKDVARTLYLKFLEENPQVDPNEVTEEMFYDSHVANVRASMVEALMIGVFFLLVSGLKEGWDDDDDDKRVRRYTLKMMNRWLDELTFYVSPASFQGITKGAIPAVGLLSDLGKFFGSLWTALPLTGDEEENEENQPMWQFVKTFIPGGNTAWQWFGEKD